MTSLVLLVTANHAGNLHYLPRLYTQLQKLKKQATPVLMIDAGVACSDEAWICAATEQRAPYIVMDAMGYDAAFYESLSDTSYQKLTDMMQLKLYDPQSVAMLPSDLRVGVDLGINQPIVRQGVLYLNLPPYEAVLQIRVTLDPLHIETVDVVTVARHILPDPTITATVEFVESEARYYQQKQSGTG